MRRRLLDLHLVEIEVGLISAHAERSATPCDARRISVDYHRKCGGESSIG